MQEEQKDDMIYSVERRYLNKCKVEDVIKRIIQSHLDQTQEKAG